MPFLDTLIVRKTDGRVKLLVYKKKTHTDQYLHFSSHHPLQHKLSVVKTLLDRSSQIVTEEEDREQEEHHIHTVLARCGYPDWSINHVKSQMLTRKTKKTTQKRIRQLSDEAKSTMVIPYSMCRTYRKLWSEGTIATAFLQPWDHSNRYVLPLMGENVLFFFENGAIRCMF